LPPVFLFIEKDEEEIDMQETMKKTKSNGVMTQQEYSSWSYHMLDEWGPKRRKRRRQAKDLADDLSKEGIESYYAQKALESQNKPVEDVRHNVVPIEQEKPSEGKYEPPRGDMEPEATYSLLDDYKVDSEDVEASTDALRSQYRRKHVAVRGDVVYASIEKA
jgi:relaxase/mobilization nuclease